MSFVGGNVYDMDTDAFRLAVLQQEAGEQGMMWPYVFNHNTSVTLGGIDYARIIEIVNGYTITFDDTAGAWVCNLVGSNNNILDVTNLTSVQVRSNNSAGLINVKELQHGIFGEEVHVAAVGGTPGTIYPAGTPLQPVDNIPDAMTIAGIRGFDTLHILGNLTLDTGDNIESMTLRGQNATRTTITVNAAADTLACEIIEATVTGNLDGGTILRNCVIENLNYINGFVYNCMIAPGTLSLGGVDTAFFLNCYSGVPGQGTPVIDLNGVSNDQDTPLAFRNYSGGIKLIQKTGTGAVSMDFSSGQLIIDSTCVAGTIVVRGDAKVVDENGVYLYSGVINGGLTLYNETTVTTEDKQGIASAVWEAATADHTTAGSFGYYVGKKLLSVAKFIGLK